jgi:hypothetical protein
LTQMNLCRFPQSRTTARGSTIDADSEPPTRRGGRAGKPPCACDKGADSVTSRHIVIVLTSRRGFGRAFLFGRPCAHGFVVRLPNKTGAGNITYRGETDFGRRKPFSGFRP